MIQRVAPSDRVRSAASTGAPDPGAWGDLLPRAVSGLVMVVLALGTAVWGGLVFTVFWGAAAVAIDWEWQHLIGPGGMTRRFAVGVLTVGLVAVVGGLGHLQLALAALAVGGGATVLVAPGNLRVLAALGTFYAVAPLLSVIVLRSSSMLGLSSILWLFAVVWGTDIMAYFAGRSIGGPKLWPRVSPAKTWSGFLVGIGCGALAGLAATWDIGRPPIALVLVGLLTGAVAQGGDLFESSFKRHYGVKDASHLIPGHGGVMDRLDGFIVAAVLAACVGVAHCGSGAAAAGLLQW